jgi:hypothetical protein
MEEIEPSTIFAEAARRFASCAATIGYCIDTRRTELAEMFGRDLRPLVVLLADDEKGRMDQLCAIMNMWDDPWIKYHAASFAYFDYGLEDARRVLEQLTSQSGLFAPLAQMILAEGGSKGWFLK